MSLHIEFEPHSWYKGFAIQDNRGLLQGMKGYTGTHWNAYAADGNTYRVIELDAMKLNELKRKITDYRTREAERTARLYNEVKGA